MNINEGPHGRSTALLPVVPYTRRCVPREAFTPWCVPREAGPSQQSVTAEQATKATHFADILEMLFSQVPPCFLGLEPEDHVLRLASTGSAVSNLGLPYSAVGTGGRRMGRAGNAACGLARGVHLEWD